MRATFCGTLVGLLLASAPALAQAPVPPAPAAGGGTPDDVFTEAPPFPERVRVSLDYAGPAGCSEEQPFKDLLHGEVTRWDPFLASWPWHLTIRVTRHGRGFDGSGELRSPTGALHWKRKIRGPLRCLDALSALALSLSLVIVPLTDPPPPAPAPACPAPPPAPAPVCPAPDCQLEPAAPPLPLPAWTRPPPEKAPLAIRLGAAAWAEQIASGWGSLGFTLDAGVRYRWLSAAIEVHGDPPLGALPSANGDVSFARITGALLLCAQWEWFVGCAKGDAGAILFPGQVRGLPAATHYDAAGVRVGLEFPVAPPRVFLRLTGDLLAPIRRAAFPLQQGSEFEIAGTDIGLGLGMLFELDRP